MARLVFMGSPAFAVPSLTALAERPDLAHVVGVVSQPDKPAGRGHKLTPCAVKIAAQARGIPVFTPVKLKAPESLEQLRAWQPDIIVVAAYGRILPKSWLDLPPRGCINVHASLLPRHRGASPIAHALLAGDAQTGVSIMRMDEGLDTGPVYGKRALPIAPDETTGSLTVKLAELGARLLIELLPDILAGRLEPTPQDDTLATYAPLLRKEDGWLDLARPAPELERHVRAMQPWPGAFFIKDGKRIQVLSARASLEPADAPAGSITAADANGVCIACGAGSLLLLCVKPEGRPAMDASAWVVGRGARVGDRIELTMPSARAVSGAT